MATARRKCRLSDVNHADVDLRIYSKVIIETIEQVIPGKNPKVFKEYFSTDVLTQSEAVTLSRALATPPVCLGILMYCCIRFSVSGASLTDVLPSPK